MKRWYQLPYREQVGYLIGAGVFLVFFIAALGVAT